MRQRETSRQVSKVQQTSGTTRYDRQESRHRGQIRDVGYIADIALKNRHQVGLEPGPATRFRMAGNEWRISSQHNLFEQLITSNHAGLLSMPCCLLREQRVNETLTHLLHLALRKRPEGQHLHSSSQGLGQLRQKQNIRGTSEEETSWLAFSVDGYFNCREEFWYVLHFIECDLGAQAGNEAIGIALGCCQD